MTERRYYVLWVRTAIGPARIGHYETETAANAGAQAWPHWWIYLSGPGDVYIREVAHSAVDEETRP